MPRPSKRVAIDTLGGRLRSARQHQHLSLADVAGSKYSTSLISQIERNRVDPSTDSLKYLAQRLKLPFEELVVLARQHRESETEANLFRDYEERYNEIQRLLASKQPSGALACFKELNPDTLPMFLRWRILALRGQAYFELRKFSDAVRDFHSALAVMPPSIAQEYQLEAVSMRLRLAAATRELNQLDMAQEYYQKALNSMDVSTPLQYVAEAHWGFALVHYLKGQTLSLRRERETGARLEGEDLLQSAWEHAESARILYNSINDQLQSALLQCHMARIEQAQQRRDLARKRLQALLQTWEPTLEDRYLAEHGERMYKLQERASVVSAAACYLAGIDCQEKHLETALKHVDLAMRAGKMSNRVRQAEAHMMYGQILEIQNQAQEGPGQTYDARIEAALREATHVLSGTDRMVARTQAHYLLGRYLISVGKTADGTRELDMANQMVGIPRLFDIDLAI